MRIVVHTDGACSNNPGPGGWGAIVCFWNGDTLLERIELSDADLTTTNNKMELSAAIVALQHIRTLPHFHQSTPVTIISDSQYVVSGATVWLPNWVRNGWRTSDKKPVKNQDLWKAFEFATAGLSVAFEWVKGHAGNVENEAADALASAAIGRLRSAA
ncbi:ribonuclease HI [Rhizobium rhizogenes]|uniref:ribonuclease HI n=1 Tax=Rhizobium rhizogenes TaxID=359 RepID=UPI0022BADF9B|nr:ribonuclease HI [Rhizobium rhizogenes]MCZ7453503.1 ribonuclease HI [Rhizobium rhizogenes]